MSGHILVLLTNNIDDLINKGEQLAKDIAAKCQTSKYHSIVEVKTSATAYYAILDDSQCIHDMATDGHISIMTGEDYEKIITEDPDAVSQVEFEGESEAGDQCNII